MADISDAAGLSDAIKAIDQQSQANTGAPTTYTITLTQGATLTAGYDLSAINLRSGDTLVISGNNAILDGNGQFRGLFVYNGNVTISDLTIQNTVAQGGTGSGGGAGLGGGLFIAGANAGNASGGGTATTGGNVTLSNVTFSNDQAIGGRGAPGYQYAGGGGLGGNGGSGSNGGGGGVGASAVGGGTASSRGSGGSGIIIGGASAGGGGANGGGGYGGNSSTVSPAGGGGGVGGNIGGNRDGGFGGGGGGMRNYNGGNGGFGGGGGFGTLGSKGNGGFGGGGAPYGGTSGFGGGATAANIGGGGLGAGGAVFVQAGGSLTIQGGVTISGGGAKGGYGGYSYSADGSGQTATGSGLGSGIFFQGAIGGSTTLKIDSGVISDDITDYNGSGGTNPNGGTNPANQGGSLAIEKTGAGTLTLSGANTYSGGTTISGGTLDLATSTTMTGSVVTMGPAGTGAIAFHAATGQTATLALDTDAQPMSGAAFGYTLVDFGDNDALTLNGFTFNSATTTVTYDSGTHVLSVSDGATTNFFNLTNETPGADGQYHASDDGNGGTRIDNVVCFATGTMIRTLRGDAPVETLKIGDLAVTASGAARAIKWVGTRSFDCAAHPQPAMVRPVRIAAGAFGAGRPYRELTLSPHHAVAVTCLDEVLIPIRLLVNGSSIAQIEDAGAVTYWHVELDSHDILLANGLPAESYIDVGNRCDFEGEASLTLYPTFAPRLQEHDDLRSKHWAHLPSPLWGGAGGGGQRMLHFESGARPDPHPSPLPTRGRGKVGASARSHPALANYCRPLVTGGGVLAAVRAQLAALVAEDTIAPAAPFHLLVDGTPIAPVVKGHAAAFAIPTGARDIRLVSPAWSPREADPSSTDDRRLGLMIQEVSVEDLFGALETIPLDDPSLAAGFHPPERNATGHWRWTDGDALIDLSRLDATAGPFVMRLSGRFAAPQLDARIDNGPAALAA